MSAPIEFYFDFSSPYSYLASEQIEPLGARYGRVVDYRPVLLGATFKVSGLQPLVDVPLKGEYSKRDFDRSARFAAVPFVLPQPFPMRFHRLHYLCKFDSQLSGLNHELLNFVSQQLRPLLLAGFR